MKENLPIHSDSMDYDELAYNNLRKFFRMGEYAISDTKTVIGGREFGKDFSIEKLNENRMNTGIEFIVQSKTFEADARDDFVNIQIDTKNINYLAKKTTTVIIHFYNRKTDVGYWIWFQEWYVTNYTPKWRNAQEKVTLKIPSTQTLSDSAVTQIMEIVTNDNFKMRVRQAIDLYNLTSQDFTFSSPEFVGNDIFSIAEPKQDGISISFQVDEMGVQAIQKANEEGYSVQFTIQSDNFPSPLETVTEPNEEIVITLIPHLPNYTIPLRVEFFDNEGNIILEHRHVSFRTIRPGAIEKEFWGQPSNESIIYSIIERIDENNNVKRKFKLLPAEPINPIKLKDFHRLYENIKCSSGVNLRYIETEKLFHTFQPQNLPPLNDELKRFAEAASILNEQHNAQLQIPPELDMNMLIYTEFVVDILTKGKSSYVEYDSSNKFKTLKSVAQDVINRYLNEGKVFLTTQEKPIEIQLQNAKFDLGKLRSVFCISEIRNIDIVKSEIANPEIVENDLITLEVLVDIEQSFTERLLPSEE